MRFLHTHTLRTCVTGHLLCSYSWVNLLLWLFQTWLSEAVGGEESSNVINNNNQHVYVKPVFKGAVSHFMRKSLVSVFSGVSIASATLTNHTTCRIDNICIWKMLKWTNFSWNYVEKTMFTITLRFQGPRCSAEMLAVLPFDIRKDEWHAADSFRPITEAIMSMIGELPSFSRPWLRG